jgi:hypothetical protein
MDVLLLAFVKQQGELVLSDDFGHGAYGAEISRGERRQRVNVMLLFAVVQIGDDVPGHVDQEDTPDAVVDQLRFKNILDPVELFLIKRV